MTVAGVAPEIEVKLEAASPDELRHIGALRALGRFRLKPRPAEELHTLYLDTRSLALARAGVALRLRSGPRGWEATVKWAGRSAGSLHERAELNVPLPARPRLPFALPPGPLQSQLSATVLGRPLAPILISDVQRHLLDLLPARGAARPLAEVALDTVQLRAPDGRPLGPSYCEVEIELRAGTRTDLTELSRALQERFGLIPSRGSKFARGMTELYGAVTRPRAVESIQRGDTLAAAARIVVAGQLARLRACDPGTRAGQDPEALHDMRVAVRRLRAATRMFDAALSDTTYDTFRHELSWLGQELGAVRDLDVQLANLEWHRPHLDAAPRRRLQALRRHMRRERAVRRDALIAALDSRRYARLLAALERFAFGTPPLRPRAAAGKPIAAVGRRAIKKALRRLLARGDTIGDLPAASDLHALRIRAKRLRYLLEALKPITGTPGRKLGKQLVRLQDLLGRFNDAMVAARWIRAYTRGPGVDSDAETRHVLEGLVDAELRRAGAAQADFRRAWRRFTSGRVRRLQKAVLDHLKEETPQEPGADSAPVRKDGAA
jgi:CHAD domain-containing protein